MIVTLGATMSKRGNCANIDQTPFELCLCSKQGHIEYRRVGHSKNLQYLVKLKKNKNKIFSHEKFPEINTFEYTVHKIKNKKYGNNNKKHVNLLAISEKRLEVRYCYEIYIFDVAIFYIIIIS